MLKGSRVTLRPLERDDLQHLNTLRNANLDLTILAEGEWFPTPLARVEKEYDDRLTQGENTWFCIEIEKHPVGEAGLFHVNRLEGHAQMAIKILDPRYVGQGYGREAIGLLLEWAFHLQNLRRIYLDVLSSNERAIRAYQACGFVIEGRMREHAHHRGTYQDLVMMGILRSEWNAARES